MKSYVLLIDCPDEKGLVHKIAAILLNHSFNMVGNSEFVDREKGHFFMRTEVTGQFDEQVVIEELQEVLPGNVNIQFKEKRKKDIVILATKEYHCLGDLLFRYHFGDLNANIKAVIGNHNVLQEVTERFGIPFHYVSHLEMERSEHEQEVLKLVQSYEPEYLVLAKYMRILSADFVKHYSNHIINIHHSFLPAFIGANPYRKAFDRGVKIIGATAHFVSNDLDEGPIIMQDTIHVDHSRTVKEMALMGKDVEKIVLAKALKLVFEDRIIAHGNKTIIFD